MAAFRCLQTFGRCRPRFVTGRACSTVTTGEETVLKGWIKKVRFYGQLVFVDVADGTSASHVQVVFKRKKKAKSEDAVWADVTPFASVETRGHIIQSIGPGQETELKASSFRLHSPCDQSALPYTMTVDELDFVSLRRTPHLRAKDRRFAAILRMRHHLRRAVQQYFDDRGFIYVDTPALTSSNCEGGGEVFQVKPANPETGPFFRDPTFLTVSGQLELEMINSGIAKVYTLSPAFRAEGKSRRHLSEFHMLEAEVAFVERVSELTELTEDLYKYIIRQVLDFHSDELAALHHSDAKAHLEYLERSISKPCIQMPFHEAVDVLKRSGEAFAFDPSTTSDLRAEHEKYLNKHCGDTPVFVTDFPMESKPFYCRSNDDEKKTSASFDFLVGGVSELAGGTLREERYDVLKERLDQLGMTDKLQGYLDVRRYGGVPHGGFGLGFDRLVSHVTKTPSLRDVTPFPRYRNAGRGVEDEGEDAVDE